MPNRNHRFLQFCFFIFFASKAQAVTLNSSKTNYTTPSDLTTSGTAISSTFSGSSSSLNKIKNTYIITTGNDGAVSSAYGIKSSGNYNQVTNDNNASIFTSGSSGRGISIANNSIAINLGRISTQGTTSYGIYSNNNNNITNSGIITTSNTTAYGIYLDGDNNSVSNDGSITTQVYGIYGNGNNNQIINSGTITTNTSSSAYGIYISAGSVSNASPTNYSHVNNSGTINSSGHGIYNKDNYSNIINSGTIVSAAGSSIYGIKNEGENSIISNLGNISSTKYAIYNFDNSTIINNSGIINGRIRLAGGTLNIFGGAINGDVEGSSGAGNINIGSNLYPAVIFNQIADFNNLNILTIKSGSTLNSGALIDVNQILIEENSTLTLGINSSTNAIIQGFNNSSGILNISGISFSSNNLIGNSNNSLANLNILSRGSLTNSNNIYADNILLDGTLNFFETNHLSIFGNVVGSGFGTINIGTQSQIINGNLTLNSGDQLAVTLNNGGVGNLAVSGFANISTDSKLLITTSSNQGYIPSNTLYDLIKSTSNPITNSISKENISINGANSNIYGLLEFTTINIENRLALKINRLPAEKVTLDKNAQNIYQNLNDISANSSGRLLAFQQYINNNLAIKDATKTLKELTPQSAKSTLAATNNIVNNSIIIAENRLEIINQRKLDNILKNNFWAQGFGGALSQKQIESDDAYKINSAGISFGLDNEISDTATMGMALSLAQSNLKYGDNSKKSIINTRQINLYGSQNFDEYFIDGIAALALHSLESKRAITTPNSNASAKHHGQTYAIKLKSGKVNYLQNGFILTPEISLNFLRNNISKYSEKGADELNLNVSNISANFLEGRAGVNLGYITKAIELADFRKFATNFKISYGHAFINDAPTTKASFAGQNSTFNSEISRMDSDSLKLGTELAAYHKDDVVFSLNYNFEHKKTLASHFITARIRQEF